ncbi:MAG: lipocalin family protein [Prevotella sp.]|nr:lipocalin family protein [Prevotella sp.]
MKNLESPHFSLGKSMRSIFKWLFVVVIAAIIVGCNDNKAQQNTSGSTDDGIVDSTMYGKCGESTAMHILQLVKDNGDSIFISLYDDEYDETISDVQGGLFVGDYLAVITGKDVDGNLYAKKVINLTSLLGKWESIDKSFEICEGGKVVCEENSSHPYTEWKIWNGHLILSPDTFDIFSLGADSLFLENNNGIYDYKRIPKEQDQQKEEQQQLDAPI